MKKLFLTIVLFLFSSISIYSQNKPKYKNIDNEYFSTVLVDNWDKTVDGRDFDNGGKRSILYLRHFESTTNISIQLNFDVLEKDCTDSFSNSKDRIKTYPVDDKIPNLKYHYSDYGRNESGVIDSEGELWVFYYNEKKLSIGYSIPIDASKTHRDNVRKITLQTVNSLKFKK